eukprot:4072433-Prymnesium_polylepis.1
MSSVSVTDACRYDPRASPTRPVEAPIGVVTFAEGCQRAKAACRHLRVCRLSAAPGGGFGVTLSTGCFSMAVYVGVAAPRVTAVIAYDFVEGCGETSVELTLARARADSSAFERALGSSASAGEAGGRVRSATARFMFATASFKVLAPRRGVVRAGLNLLKF